MDDSATALLELNEATLEDLPLLADLNRQRQEDQHTPELMSLEALAARMRSWLAADYHAIAFYREIGFLESTVYFRIEGPGNLTS
jgi:hypothetical protein